MVLHICACVCTCFSDWPFDGEWDIWAVKQLDHRREEQVEVVVQISPKQLQGIQQLYKINIKSQNKSFKFCFIAISKCKCNA